MATLCTFFSHISPKKLQLCAFLGAKYFFPNFFKTIIFRESEHGQNSVQAKETKIMTFRAFGSGVIKLGALKWIDWLTLLLSSSFLLPGAWAALDSWWTPPPWAGNPWSVPASTVWDGISCAASHWAAWSPHPVLEKTKNKKTIPIQSWSDF